ncbi:unnamed protein product [Cuscuta campestris]|uniref:Leucine-rich repeat-containing N-terminal plant-type domain-containing protein n=1 Tax=Cuscuta campestris TaxID=132261 RepID=A0A484MX97_9ASTE|nr:unnamed protein product [Cuscuta campestris]
MTCFGEMMQSSPLPTAKLTKDNYKAHQTTLSAAGCFWSLSPSVKDVAGLGKLKNLEELHLRENLIYGDIDSSCLLCNLTSLRVLDLAINNFTGKIASTLANLTSLQHLDLLGNNFEDTVFLSSFANFSKLERFDLSCNNLTGVIPPELGNLMHVYSINLSHNFISGSIPNTFYNLKQIESLDLSFNNLSGTVPHQLVELNFLEVFNVSYNNLTGRTPDTGQFASFVESSYLGNPGLCCSVVNKSCTPDNEMPPPSSPSEEDDGDSGIIDMVDFLWSFGVSSIIMFLATMAVFRINPHLLNFVDRCALYLVAE